MESELGTPPAGENWPRTELQLPGGLAAALRKSAAKSREGCSFSLTAGLGR